MSSRCRCPTANTARYEIVHHPGGAAIVAIDDQRRVCLLRQFRPAAAAGCGSCPPAGSNPVSRPRSTARRELRRGGRLRTAASWEDLGSILSSPGVFAETIHLYLARELAAGRQPARTARSHRGPLGAAG